MITRNPVKGEQGLEMMIIYRDDQAMPERKRCFSIEIEAMILFCLFYSKILFLCQSSQRCHFLELNLVGDSESDLISRKAVTFA